MAGRVLGPYAEGMVRIVQSDDRPLSQSEIEACRRRARQAIDIPPTPGLLARALMQEAARKQREWTKHTHIHWAF